jgi:hypothetical protein
VYSTPSYLFKILRCPRRFVVIISVTSGILYNICYFWYPETNPVYSTPSYLSKIFRCPPRFFVISVTSGILKPIQCIPPPSYLSKILRCPPRFFVIISVTSGNLYNICYFWYPKTNPVYSTPSYLSKILLCPPFFFVISYFWYPETNPVYSTPSNFSKIFSCPPTVFVNNIFLMAFPARSYILLFSAFFLFAMAVSFRYSVHAWLRVQVTNFFVTLFCTFLSILISSIFSAATSRTSSLYHCTTIFPSVSHEAHTDDPSKFHLYMNLLRGKDIWL